MGGVDLIDQLLCNYSLRKTLIWWKKVFWHLVDLCIVNAYVIKKESTGKQIDQKTFREQRVSELTNNQTQRGENWDDPANQRGCPHLLADAPHLQVGTCRGPRLFVAARTSGMQHKLANINNGTRRTCRVCVAMRSMIKGCSQNKD